MNLSEGKFSKYRQAFIGDRGFIYFLYFEFASTFIAPIPGNIGIFLRRFFYPKLFKRFGKRIKISEDVVFRKPHLISISDEVSIGSHSCLDVKGDGKAIYISQKVRIGSDCIFSCAGGEMKLGKSTFFGSGSRVGCHDGVSIGDNSILENNCYVIGAQHSYENLKIPIIDQQVTCRGTTCLGENVHLGRGSTIIDGVIIGNNTQILPNSLVVKSIPELSIVSGVPARIKK